MRVYLDILGWINLDTAPFARGGEVCAFNVANHPDVVATIYHQGRTPDHLEWWTEQVRAGLKDVKGVVQCHGVVRAMPAGLPIGVLWSRAPGKVLTDNLPASAVERVVFCARLVALLLEVMARGFIYSDLKGNNLHRTDDNEPVLIDILSVSTVGPIKFPDGTIKARQFEMGPGVYTAPEMTVPGAPCIHTAVTLAHTAFVLVWELLKDHPPWAIIGRDDQLMPDKDVLGAGLYGRFEDFPAYLTPADDGVPFTQLHTQIQVLMNNAFRRGRKSPTERPSIRELHEALEAWASDLTGKPVTAAAPAIRNRTRLGYTVAAAIGMAFGVMMAGGATKVLNGKPATNVVVPMAAGSPMSTNMPATTGGTEANPAPVVVEEVIDLSKPLLTRRK